MIRGDVFRLPPPRRAQGHEQRGSRFAVVLQDDDFATLSTVIVAPTSRAAQPTSFRPTVEIRDLQTRVLVEQLRAVDPQRLGEHAGRLSAEDLADVDRALRLILSL